MLTIVIVASFFTAFEFLTILGKFSPTLLKRVLGYEWAVDIIMSFGMMLFFGLTGSITGIIISAITGFIFSAALYASKHTLGYQKYEKGADGTRSWVEYPATWTWEAFGGFTANAFRGIVNVGKRIVNGMKAANDDKAVAA
jgi:hypothetical protein